MADNIRYYVGENREKCSLVIAKYIVDYINQRKEGKVVLGLATGSTPIPIYQALIRMHKEGQVSFANVMTINLDEYYPIEPTDTNSYHYFMNENFFKHVDFNPENHCIPSGTVSKDGVQAHCEEYEKVIEKDGIDIQLLGIGRSGHIGFNEPGSNVDSHTRLVELHEQTIKDAADTFGGVENVPKTAITMGIASIFKAKECILCAWGSSKQEILQRALTSIPTSDVPASFLKNHPNVWVVTDPEAAPKK